MEISVSIVAARWRALCSAARWKPRSAPEHDGCREEERDPLPARELKRRDHGERRKRCSQRDGDDEAPPKNRRRLVVVVMRARVVNRMGVVPGALDRRHEVVDPHRLVAVDRRLLGGEVDGRLDAVELVELALDPAHARGAGHAVEIEADLLQGAAALTRGGRHAASYPASTIAARSAASSRSLPRDGHDLRLEIDGDVVDALDLGHLLADRHGAVRAVDRGNAVDDRLAQGNLLGNDSRG